MRSLTKARSRSRSASEGERKTPGRMPQTRTLRVRRESLPGFKCQTRATSGAVWAVSKWDQATWGDGAGDVKLSDVISDKGNHIRDALIATTAAAECEVLVTDEKKRLPNKIKNAGSRLKVWNSEQFISCVKLQTSD